MEISFWKILQVHLVGFGSVTQMRKKKKPGMLRADKKTG